MTRSTAPLSLGRMGLANGGPGGCMPAKTVHAHGNGDQYKTHTNGLTFYCMTLACKNLPTPGMGEQGVLSTAPCWMEGDRADLSGGPPGAERGKGSVREQHWIKIQTKV